MGPQCCATAPGCLGTQRWAEKDAAKQVRTARSREVTESYRCQGVTNSSACPVERRVGPGAAVSQWEVMTSDRKQGSLSGEQGLLTGARWFRTEIQGFLAENVDFWQRISDFWWENRNLWRGVLFSQDKDVLKEEWWFLTGELWLLRGERGFLTEH